MKKIGVLGTGTMGAGIIQVLAQSGYDVVMRARRQTSVDKGLATVEKNLSRLVAKEKITEERKAERAAVGLLAELQLHARTQRPALVVRPQV